MIQGIIPQKQSSLFPQLIHISTSPTRKYTMPYVPNLVEAPKSLALQLCAPANPRPQPRISILYRFQASRVPFIRYQAATQPQHTLSLTMSQSHPRVRSCHRRDSPRKSHVSILSTSQSLKSWKRHHHHHRLSEMAPKAPYSQARRSKERKAYKERSAPLMEAANREIEHHKEQGETLQRRGRSGPEQRRKVQA